MDLHSAARALVVARSTGDPGHDRIPAAVRMEHLRLRRHTARHVAQPERGELTMSMNHRVGKSVVRALAASAALAVISFMAPTPARAQAPWVAPERASQRSNPIPATADAVKRGHN